MRPRQFVILASLLVAAGALILLLVTVHATASGGQSVACGNGFKTDMSQAAHDSNVNNLKNAFLADGGYGYLATTDVTAGYQQACDSALSTRRGIGFGLLGVAGLAFLGGLVVRRPEPPARAAPPAAA